MTDRQKLAQWLLLPLLVVFVGLLWIRVQAMRGGPQVVTLPPAATTPPAAEPHDTTGAPAAAPSEPPAPALPARDPFVPPPAIQQTLRPPPVPKETTPELPKRPMPTLAVQGVLWGITPPRAIINDQIVTPGDTLQGVRILSIDRHGITVDFDGTQTVLTPPAPGRRQHQETMP